MFVKICGIKTPEMAKLAEEAGADMIGVVCYKKSKRYVTPEQAKAIKEAVSIPVAAVTVNIADCEGYEADYIQADDANKAENHMLSGSEVPTGVFKYFVYDASRGAGIRADYPDWVCDYRDKLILAGGLTPENVAEVIELYKPFGVDVSSGVETDSEKDIKKIKEFIMNAKRGNK